jgi:hypothetical protein
MREEFAASAQIKTYGCAPKYFADQESDGSIWRICRVGLGDLDE